MHVIEAVHPVAAHAEGGEAVGERNCMLGLDSSSFLLWGRYEDLVCFAILNIGP